MVRYRPRVPLLSWGIPVHQTSPSTRSIVSEETAPDWLAFPEPVLGLHPCTGAGSPMKCDKHLLQMLFEGMCAISHAKSTSPGSLILHQPDRHSQTFHRGDDSAVAIKIAIHVGRRNEEIRG